MSEDIPLHVLRVSDFHTSLIFYRDKLGFATDRFDPEGPTVLFAAPGKLPLLVTADPGLDIASFVGDAQVSGALSGQPDPGEDSESGRREAEGGSEQAEVVASEVAYAEGAVIETVSGEEREEGTDDAREEDASLPYVEVSRGDRLEFPGENLLIHQERLATLGIADMLLEENPGVEQLLILTDPDGYEIAFRESLRLSADELFALYGKGADLLEGAIMGLTEEDLELPTDEDDGETIRHTILQMVDFDLEMMQRIKWALAESGRSYPLALYDADEWAEALDYASRPIHVEVAMLRMVRDHVLTLCERLPAALERHLVSEHGTVEVHTMMQVTAESAREQIQAILDTRRRYGK